MKCLVSLMPLELNNFLFTRDRENLAFLHRKIAYLVLALHS